MMPSASRAAFPPHGASLGGVPGRPVASPAGRCPHASRAGPDDAAAAIAGYAISHDVSEREFQVNGETRQDGSTSDMIFGVDHLVWYVSQFMVLRPGDVINTGTPAGVALGRPRTPYLTAGDVVELEIDGLGRQRQVFAQARA